jgi:hypothetical protein
MGTVCCPRLTVFFTLGYRMIHRLNLSSLQFLSIRTKFVFLLSCLLCAASCFVFGPLVHGGLMWIPTKMITFFSRLRFAFGLCSGCSARYIRPASISVLVELSHQCNSFHWYKPPPTNFFYRALCFSGARPSQVWNRLHLHPHKS